jgi:hypothetical protein
MPERRRKCWIYFTIIREIWVTRINSNYLTEQLFSLEGTRLCRHCAASRRSWVW